MSKTGKQAGKKGRKEGNYLLNKSDETGSSKNKKKRKKKEVEACPGRRNLRYGTTEST